VSQNLSGAEVDGSNRRRFDGDAYSIGRARAGGNVVAGGRLAMVGKAGADRRPDIRMDGGDTSGGEARSC
jgi:hypothetical protein